MITTPDELTSQTTKPACGEDEGDEPPEHRTDPGLYQVERQEFPLLSTESHLISEFQHGTDGGS